MVERKGVGYSIEVILALTTLFIFAIGNTPSEPVQDWNNFQKDIAADDLGYTLKQTGDMENFLKRREFGSLKTTADTLSSGQLKVSGTINNLPIKDISIGINSIPSQDIENKELQPQGSCTNDLDEIETDEDILETQRDDPRLYIADTDPLQGDDQELNYDTIYVDNKTDCQFTPSEGPYYFDDFFNWKDRGNDDYYEFKNVTYDGSNYNLIIHDGDRAISLRETMNNEVSEVKTSQSFTTFNISGEDLSNHDIIVFDGKDSLDQIENHRNKVDRFMTDKPVVLLMDLGENDFENRDFIKSSGMEWIDLSYQNTENIAFTDSRSSEEAETYFDGMSGSRSGTAIDPGGKVSSSNSDTVIDQEKYVVSETGGYDTSDWKALNSSMKPIDPSNVDGIPESSCTEDGEKDSNLTKGKFSFPTYQAYKTGISSKTEYNVTNIELGSDKQFCDDRDVRALSIDLNRNGDYSDKGEGPYLVGEDLKVENKSFEVSIQDGSEAEFVYTSNPSVEKVNIRRSFRNSNIDTLIRFPYGSSYNDDDKKLLASIIYRISADKKKIQDDEPTPISSKVYGSFQKSTYLPYKASLRWR